MSNSKLTTLESIMIIVSIITSHIVLSITTSFLKDIRSGAILNVIYVSILAILFAYLIYKLFIKFPGCDLLDVTEFLGGKIVKNILGFIFITYFLITSGFFLRDFCESLKIIYYPMTNVVFVIFFFIIALCITNRLEFNASLKTTIIIIPLVLLSIIFLFFCNFRNFSFERIFPIMGNGFFNIFVSGIGNIFAFSGIVFLYFMPPLLKEPEKFKKVAILSMVLSAIYLLFSICTLLFIFSFFITTKEIIPLYSAARYIEFGTFVQRLESVFLLLWIISFACYLSVLNKFAILIFKKITNIKDSRPLVYPFSLLLLGICLIPRNQAFTQYYKSTVFPIVVLCLIFGLSIVILLLANFKKRKMKVGELKNNE